MIITNRCHVEGELVAIYIPTVQNSVFQADVEYIVIKNPKLYPTWDDSQVGNSLCIAAYYI